MKKTKSTDIKSKRHSFGTPSPPFFTPCGRASQIALPETKFASPPPSFLVREAVPRLPSKEGNLGRNRPSLPSLEGNLGHFWSGRASWDAFGERPSLPSFTTEIRLNVVCCQILIYRITTLVSNAL